MTWNELLNIILIIYIVLLGICAIAYVPRMRAWFYGFKKEKHLVNDKQNKIAVLIPARNESKVIVDLLNSAKEQTYPADKFDLHIIVKEENDPTIEITKKYGYDVHIIADQTCKGDALEFTLQDILAKTPDLYDAYLVVDADCVMEKHMLEELNNALASGRDVVQCKKIVKNYLYGDKKSNTYATCCNGLIWPLIDDLGNKYKSDHNITAMTIGTGIMMTSKVIKKIGGWPYRQTLTEDIEFMYDCVLQDFTCYYCGYAKIYVEEATSLNMTNKRRTRWMTGVVDSYRLYNDRIKTKRDIYDTKEIKKNVYFTTALQIVYVYIGLLISFIGLMLLMALGFAIFGINLWLKCLVLAAIGFGVIYISFGMMSWMCVLVDWKNIKLNWFKKILLAIVHPFFYMGYIRIVSKALFGKNNKGWEVIERVDFASDSKKEEK